MTISNPSPEHQRLVAALVAHFQTKLGYTILSAANYGNFPQPEKHGRHAPDVVARDQRGVLHLAEAETGNSIYAQDTGEQLFDFSNRVMTGTNIPVPFHIVVYKKDYNILIQRLRDLGLSYKINNQIIVWTL